MTAALIRIDPEANSQRGQTIPLHLLSLRPPELALWLNEHLAHACALLAHKGFDLAESFLYGVEVRLK